MRKIWVGVINWDSALPPDTYFGYYTARALSPIQYRNRVPFYADIIDGIHITFHTRTDAEYTRELQLAADAGIDYFAHVWYGEDKINADHFSAEKLSPASEHVWELTAVRKLHARNPLREKVKLCAILCTHPLSDKDLLRLADEMQQPYYQQINGRPLVYIYGGFRGELIARLRKICREIGTTDPYVAFMDGSCSPQPDFDYTAAQAVSNYSCVKNEVQAYKDVAAQMIANNEQRRAYHLPIIPLFSAGWNPMPRVENPVPWVPYRAVDYAPPPNGEELFAAAVQLADWIQRCKSEVADHILTFAWNEFEEGGFLCPTKGANGEMDTERLAAFARCVQYWKTNL